MTSPLTTPSNIPSNTRPTTAQGSRPPQQRSTISDLATLTLEQALKKQEEMAAIRQKSGTKSARPNTPSTASTGLTQKNLDIIEGEEADVSSATSSPGASPLLPFTGATLTPHSSAKTPYIQLTSDRIHDLWKKLSIDGKRALELVITNEQHFRLQTHDHLSGEDENIIQIAGKTINGTPLLTIIRSQRDEDLKHAVQIILGLSYSIPRA